MMPQWIVPAGTKKIWHLLYCQSLHKVCHRVRTSVEQTHTLFNGYETQWINWMIIAGMNLSCS